MQVANMWEACGFASERARAYTELISHVNTVQVCGM